jgi:hypothetical protein
MFAQSEIIEAQAPTEANQLAITARQPAQIVNTSVRLMMPPLLNSNVTALHAILTVLFLEKSDRQCPLLTFFSPRPKQKVLSDKERTRDDESPDSIFYSSPRLTLHYDMQFATKLQV